MCQVQGGKKAVWNTSKPLKENQDKKSKHWVIPSFCSLKFIWKALFHGLFVDFLNDIDVYLPEVKEQKLDYCFNINSLYREEL